MNKANGLILLMVLLGSSLLIYVFFFYSKDKLKVTPQKTSLGIFKFITLKEEILAQSGEFVLLKKDFTDDISIKAFEEEKKELSIAEIYKQFARVGKDASRVVFYIDKPKRSLTSLFNQYGILFYDLDKISFEKAETFLFAVVDDKKISLENIKKNYRWAALETKILQRYLYLIKEDLKRKSLTHMAKQKEISTQKYIEEEILLGEKGIVGELRDKKIDAFLKNIISLPIEVNLSPPYFNIEFKPDWTPSLGPENSSKKVIIFNDFYSESARHLIMNLPSLAAEYPHVYFGFRPIFPEQNQYQRMLAEIGFCVWSREPSAYWTFLSGAIKARPKGFEKRVYEEVELAGLHLEPVKECFYKQEHKKIVNYHLDYAKYLDIPSGPVIFIDGQVYTAALTSDAIKTILNQ